MSDLAFLGNPIPDAWDEVTLATVTSKVGSGATPRGGSTVYIDSGVAFIRSKNVHDHVFRDEGIVNITDAAAEQLRGVTVERNDVLINITGDSILRTCVVPDDVLPARVSQHVAIVRANDRVAPDFLQKWLSLPAMKDFMLGHSSGGTRKAVTKGHLLSFPIPLPPLSEQLGIAATLRALDDKIESNQRSIKLTTQLASELVRRERLSNGSDLVKIADVVEFHNRRRVPLSSKQRDERPGPYPYYGASGVFGYVDDFLFDEVLVLVGEDGSVVNDDGTPVTQYIWGKAWINNHAHPLTGNGISNELLFVVLRESDVRPIVTGAVQPKINMGNLKSLEISVPSGKLDRLESDLSALFAVYRERADETAWLRVIRDTLMPELLAGRIRVPEADEALA